MNVDVNIFKNLYNEDTIYHYTKTSTAIDFILFNQQLKFNIRQNSNDPIESLKARRCTFYSDHLTEKSNIKDEIDITKYLHRYISNLEKVFIRFVFVIIIWVMILQTKIFFPILLDMKKFLVSLNLECGTNMLIIIMVYVSLFQKKI